jgi:ABC-type multidrug transport system fused ATPase/permease subunit
VVILAVMIASFILGTAASNAESLVTGYSAAASFFEILERIPTIDTSSSSGEKLETYAGNLQLTDVDFRYSNGLVHQTITNCEKQFRYPSRPEQKILDNISLDIPAGKKVAIVGPSGSGKSSIVQLLQRFYDPEEGQISLDGYDLKDLNVTWLRRQVQKIIM